jgi:hypothetical protein
MAQRLKPMDPGVAGGAKSDQENAIHAPRAAGDGRRASTEIHRRGSGGDAVQNTLAVAGKTAAGVRLPSAFYLESPCCADLRARQSLNRMANSEHPSCFAMSPVVNPSR